ncbi:MAG: flagellar protein [Vulcanibacillus sp.]
MSLGGLSNCSKCGSLFISNGKSVCPQCISSVEAEYKACADYLRENNLVNIYLLSEVTGVSVKQITKFVQEGRISVAESPNLGYPCESCGASINKGRLCDKCTAIFNKEVNKLSKGSNEISSKNNIETKSAYFKIKNNSDK